MCDCFCLFVADSSVFLPLLSISSTLHLLFLILLLLLYLSFLGCLTASSLCITFCLCSLLCSLSLSHSPIHSHLVSLVFFPFLVCATLHHHTPPFFSLLVSLGSVVIKSVSSLAENNKQSLLKSAIAVWRLSGVPCRYCFHLWRG